MEKTFIFLILILLSCSKEKKLPTRGEEFVKEFKVFHFSGGEKIWEIIAKEGRYSGETIFIKDFIVKFYHEAGVTTMEAKSGKLDLNKKSFSTIGKTTFTSPLNEKLISWDVQYDPKGNKIFSEREVMMTYKDKKISGKGLCMNPDFSKVTIGEVTIK